MANSKTSGCLIFPMLLFISAISAGIVRFFVPISIYSTFAFLLLLNSWIWASTYKNNRGKKSYRYFIYSIALIGFFVVFRHFVLNTVSFPDHFSAISEHIYKEKRFEHGDSIVLLSQKRVWRDNYGNRYQGVFSVREKAYYHQVQEYINYAKKHPNLKWGTLYSYMIREDRPSLDLILERLDEIKNTKALNQLEFAEMVVTFVQDIPYSYVFDTPCKAPERYEASIRKTLRKCPECCIGEIPYGVQNPVGFMGNLKGDCDTRTVLIYALLDYFGYDVVILNSTKYLHSIIGIHLPASGLYKVHQGKRYYAWETTGKYFTLGTLPKSIDNMNHWDVAKVTP